MVKGADEIWPPNHSKRPCTISRRVPHHTSKGFFSTPTESLAYSGPNIEGRERRTNDFISFSRVPDAAPHGKAENHGQEALRS